MVMYLILFYGNNLHGYGLITSSFFEFLVFPEYLENRYLNRKHSGIIN